ncbi:MAG: protein kinase [Kofleriaceae bacterium]
MLNESHGSGRSRYVLEHVLGRGSSADVFLGYAQGEEGFRRPVAIRRLFRSLARDAEFVQRLARSVNRLVGIHHGNLVGVLDLAREGADVLVVTELVDGPSTRQLLEQSRGAPLPLGVCAYIIQSAAEGLAYAHSRSIVHASLTPTNLLVTSFGEVRVADFSVDGDRTPAPRDPRRAYMAPEQLRGEGATHRSDVFALGAVLYELIAGVQPFASPAVRGSGAVVSTTQIVPPSRIRPEVPTSLDAICARALAHRPDHRFEHMQHLIDALIDARFSNRWHDGASALAALLRRVAPAGAAPLKTMATAHPVTLWTDSMIGSNESQVITTQRPRLSARPEHIAATRLVTASIAPLVSAPRAPVTAPITPLVSAPRAPVTTAPIAPLVSAPRARVTTAPIAPLVRAPVAPVGSAPVAAHPALGGSLVGPAVAARRSPRPGSALGNVHGGAAGRAVERDAPIVINRWAFVAFAALAVLVAVLATLALQSADPGDLQVLPPHVSSP